MKRLLLLLGSAIALIGSLGLVLFGSAIVGVFKLIALPAFDGQSADPAASLRPAAFSGIALAIGLVISCCATVMGDSKQTISRLGKVLCLVAGGLLFVGTVPSLWAIRGAWQSFRVLATSAEATLDSEIVAEMIGSTAPAIAIGCGIFAVAAVVLLVAGLVGFQAKSAEGTGTNRLLGFLILTGSVLLAIIVSLLLIRIWVHGSRLELLISETSGWTSYPPLSAVLNPDPQIMGENLSGVLLKSFLVFVGLALLGIMQVLAAIAAPSPGTDVRTEETVQEL